MNLSTWFDDLPVLGKLPLERAAEKLREVGDIVSAQQLENAADEATALETAYGKGARPSWWPFQDKPWQHTAHAFGYIAPASAGQEKPLPIQYAGNIQADAALKQNRIKITLDRLRVADYPGSGLHQILFDFYAQNQVPGNIEHLHFTATYRALEGEQVAVIGYPIFVGLNVGTEGVAFKCFTVNVKNVDDEAFLTFLDSDVFKAGLKLASTIQPATAPLSGLALGMTKAIAARHRNVPVQDFYMGLDFSTIPTRARLAEGAYIAVQIPEKLQIVWDWNEWVYNPANGRIVNADDKTKMIPYNYVVFSVSRYEGE